MNKDLRKRIEVTAPYFALTNVQAHPDGLVTANMTPEQNKGGEESLMAAAEVGRHLAILGSLAFAAAQPTDEKHYYLAQQATFRRLDAEPADLVGPLSGAASITHLDSRLAEAATKLFNAAGKPLFNLDVSYKVLREAAFDRLFKSARTDFVADPSRNPYLSNTPLRVYKLDNSGMEAFFGPIRAEDCAGHFDHYPCLPVAIVMHILGQAAGYYYALAQGLTPQDALNIGRAYYQVQRATIRANTLIFAGQAVRIVIRPPREHPSQPLPADWAEIEVLACNPHSDEVYASTLATLSPAPNCVLRKSKRDHATFVPSRVHFNASNKEGEKLWSSEVLTAAEATDLPLPTNASPASGAPAALLPKA